MAMPDSLAVAVPPRDRFGWRDWATLVLAVGLALGIWHVDSVTADVKKASTVNRQIGYRNRAAICDFTREFGGSEPRTCADPALRPYRDVAIRPGDGERRNTTSLLCIILAALNQRAPQCAGGG